MSEHFNRLSMACFDVLILLQLNDVISNLCKTLDSNGAVIVVSRRVVSRSSSVWARSSIKEALVHFCVSFAGKHGYEIMVGLEQVLLCPGSGDWFVVLISLQEDLYHTDWRCSSSVALSE